MDVTQTGRTSLYINDKAIDFFSVDLAASAHKAAFIHLSKLRLRTAGLTTSVQREKPVLPDRYLREGCKKLSCKQRTETSAGAQSWPPLCHTRSGGLQAWLPEDSNGKEENARTEEHSHLRSSLMSKACYFAPQLHYYPSIIFGRECRVSFYRFMLFALNSHWELEINRQEGGEHSIVLSKRNFVLNQSMWERYDH